MDRGRRYWSISLGAVFFFAAGVFYASHASRRGTVVASEIQLLDQEGRTRASLKTGAHGEPGLALYDAAGNARLTAGLSESGEPSVNLLSAQGGLVWRAASNPSSATQAEAATGALQGGQTMAWKLESAAFASMGSIPVVHTCEGEDLSPPLGWNAPPEGTASLALIVDDPDAPDPKAPRVTWVHWVLYNLPADSRRLDQGVPPGDLPPGAVEGLNDWKRTGYGGPCPPVGRHRYFFKLYALDQPLEVRGPIGKKELEAAMEGHVLAKTELVGTYQKTGR